MLLADLPRVLLARWYVVLAGLLLTALLGVLTTALVPLRHTAQAQLLLLPSRADTGEGGNPYAGLGGLGPAVDVLSRAMSNDTTARTLEAAGLRGTYVVGADVTSSAPLVVLTATSDTAPEALQSVAVLVAQAPATLAELQRTLGIDDRSALTSTVVTQSAEAEVVRTPQLRALVVALAAGLGATLLSTALLDRALVRRRERRLDPPAGPPEAAAAPPAQRPVPLPAPQAESQPSRAGRRA